MSKPYTTQTITGYNSAPPADDGSQVSSNEIKWSNHKTKLGDPVKTLSEAINTELLSAFGLIFGQTISSHSGDYTIVAGDQGKFLDVTGTTTITLLLAATAGEGFALAIINNGTGIVTVDGSGAETINGSATITLYSGDHAIITCNGTLWVGPVKNSNLIYETEVTGSAVTTITVPGLDLDTHKSYRLELEVPTVVTSTVVNIYANNLTTNADYWSQLLDYSGTSVSAAQVNSPRIATILSTGAVLVIIDIGYASGRHISFFSKGILGAPVSAGPNTRLYTVNKTAELAANLTRLDLSSDTASQLVVGTKVRLYKT